jgi:type IX secretion system PorP/SprF family membrane protein
MKNAILYLLLAGFLAGTTVSAQQLPNFIGQFGHPALYNPARNGDGQLAVNYRQQWLGIEGDDAPTSYYLHADLSQLLQLDAKRIGAAIQFMGDKAHILSTNRISVDFAYHLIDEPGQRLSAGIRAGLASQSIEFGEVRVNDPFDLELFSGSTSGSSLDGGPGIAYYLKTEGGVLNLDVSALQLFADRLELENGSFFDWQRHLVARASYRLPVGAANLQLEPTLVYRQVIDEFQLKKDKLDLAMQAHFADRLRLTLGTRIGAQTYYLGFAVNLGPSAPIGIQAAYETDDVFGGSYEIGLSYFTGEPASLSGIVEAPGIKPVKPEKAARDPRLKPVKPAPTTKPAPAPSPRPEKPAAVNYALYQSQLNTALNAGAAPIDRAANALGEAHGFMDQVLRPGTSIQGKKTGLRLAKDKIEAAVKSLRLVAVAVDQGRTNIFAMRQAAGLSTNEPPRNGKLRKTMKEFSEMTIRYQTLEQNRTGLVGDYAAVEATMTPSVLEDLRSGNLAGIQQYFTDKVAGTRNLPSNFGPVTVTRAAGGGFEVAFPYTKSGAAFSIDDPSRNDVKQLISAIGWEAKRLVENGANLGEIILRAELRDPEEDQRLDDEAGVYNSEFGTSSVTFGYMFENGTTRSRQPRNAAIRQGNVDFVDLTVLKLESMKRELSKIGIPLAKVKLEIAAPVAQQGLERYVIKVVLRP